MQDHRRVVTTPVLPVVAAARHRSCGAPN